MAPQRIMSTTRPGVPTTTWAPALSCCCCCHLLAPPNTATTERPKGLA